VTLKSGSKVTQSHGKWYLLWTGYGFLLVLYRNIVLYVLFEVIDFKNAVTLKTGLGVRQGNLKYHHSIERIELPIDVL